MSAIPYVAGLGPPLFVLLVASAVNGFQDPLQLVRGTDNRPSTSQFQFWLWTLVVAFAYVSIWTARAMKGVPDPVSDVPTNVLLVMGFSTGTLAGAKAITGALVDAGRMPKTIAATPATGPLGGIMHLLTGDDGSVDLQKVQILMWTALTVVIYLILTAGTVAHIQQLASAAALHDEIQSRGSVDGLPNIDGALMVLMGLSQAAYLGGKLTSASQPRITAMSTSTLVPGQHFSVFGVSLGNDADAGQITLDGIDVPVTRRCWTPTRIDVRMPDPWPAAPVGPTVMLRVVTAGQVSDPWPVQVRPGEGSVSVSPGGTQSPAAVRGASTSEPATATASGE